MRIRGFHIDGFGIYANHGVQDIPPGLVLFLGENESGKTTLMEFIRTILFGPGREKNKYEPLQGGNQGGRLQVQMQDGRTFTIERSGKRTSITGAGISIEKANISQVLFNSAIDRQTFERIFAIGLKEMYGLDILSQENVRGRLFSAGAGLGAASVPGAMQTLDKELENLLALRAKKRINDLVGQMKDKENQIKKLRELPAVYAATQQRLEELGTQITACKTEAEELRQKLRQLERLELAREPWNQCLAAREKAKLRAFARDFPPRGLERFEMIKQETEALRSHLEARTTEATRLEGELNGLQLDSALLEQRQAIEVLLEERQKLAQALSDHPEVKSKLEQSEAEFKRRLQELGPEWDVARLAQVDTSVQVRQRVQEFELNLSQAERRFEEAQASEHAFKERADAARHLYEEAARQWQEAQVPPMADEHELKRKRGALRAARPLLHQREVAAAQLAEKLKAKDDTLTRLEGLQTQFDNYRPTVPWWLWIPALLLGLAAVGALSFFQRAYLTAAIAGAAGTGLSLMFHLLHRGQKIAAAVRFHRDQDQIEQALADLEADISDLQEQIQSLDRDLERLAGAAELALPKGLTQLEQLDVDLEDAAQQLRDWRTLEREQNKTEAQWRDATEKLEGAEEQTEKASQEWLRLKQEWAGWLAARAFSEVIRPEGFEAVLQAVESARGARRNLDDYRRRLALLDDYLAEARGKILRVLNVCGRLTAAAEVGVAELDSMRQALAAALETYRQQKELQTKLQLAQEDAARLSRQISEKEGELSRLLQAAGAGDEEEFRRLAAGFEEWREAVQKQEANELVLRNLAGTSEAQAALEEELRVTDPLELQAEKELVQARLKELDGSISDDDQEKGKLMDRLAEMTQNEKLGEILLEQRSLKEQLADAVRRWATLGVCRHLLEQAQRVYERERQPSVIQEAGGFLHTMVHGRYRLVSSVGEIDVQLEDASLRRKEEHRWSDGLKDQVYLAIRLGLACEFSRHTEPLPVILDDVLVKFDPARRRNAAIVILRFARSQQVLLFSCHPELKEVIAKVRQDLDYQDIAVAYYAIADGVITPSVS
jgi:uncharacterized protein YhaN